VEPTLADGYFPGCICESDPDLHAAIDLIDAGTFSRGDRDLFRPLTTNLLDHDPFLVCADFREYADRQAEIGSCLRDPRRWTRTSILNAARCGRFSSDHWSRAVISGGEETT
jgi:glycogen phosphorylase